MNRLISLLAILLSFTASVYAETLSPPMENAVSACANLSMAMATRATAHLKAANNALKQADIVPFGNLRIDKGSEISTDGHFIFDEEFIENLIENGEVLTFSSKYAKKREARGDRGTAGKIKMTTKALKAGGKAVWKTVNRRRAEYAVVAEPGGLLTMTIRDEKGKVLYAEKVNNKKGELIRKALVQLPDQATKIYIEIKNNGKSDISFAIIANR